MYPAATGNGELPVQNSSRTFNLHLCKIIRTQKQGRDINHNPNVHRAKIHALPNSNVLGTQHTIGRVII